MAALTAAELQGATPLGSPLSQNDLAGAVPLDSVQPAEVPGRLEAFARGAKQGATFGFGDELTGAIESLFTAKTYKQSRDEARAADKAAKDAHAGYFTAGEVGGGIATSLVPTGALVEGAGLAANIARGAGAGIAAGIGGSEAEDVGGIAKDAAIGGLTGGVVGGVAGTVADRVLGGAVKRADRTLMSDIGNRATKTVRDKMSDISPQILKTARESGLDTIARDAGALAERSTGLRKEVGKRIGDTLSAVDEHYLGASVDDVATAIDSVKKRFATPIDAPVRNQIDTLADNVTKQWKGERVPLAKLNELIGKLEKQGFASADLTPSAAAELKRDLAGNLEAVLQKRFNEIQESAANYASAGHSVSDHPLFGPAQKAGEGLKDLPSLNQQYRSLKLIEKAAKQRDRETPYSPTGLRSFTLRGLGEKAYDATLGQVQRPADVALAKLTAAAQGGDKTAAMVVKALTQGAPRGLAANAGDLPAGVLAPLGPDDQPY